MGFATSAVAGTSSTLAAGAETAVSSVAVLILAASPGARLVVLQNTGANAVRIGAVGVTATTGFRLAAGVIAVFSAPTITGGALYAIRETSDSTVLAQVAS